MNRSKWAQLVKERDNYTCMECGATEQLEAHHILPVYEYPEKELFFR